MQESILTLDQYQDLTKRIIPLNSLKHLKYHLKIPVCVSP